MSVSETRGSARPTFLVLKDQSARLTYIFDALAIAALCMVATSLFYRHAATIGPSYDGFLLTYASFIGDLQAFIWSDIKEPGRPFVGLAIKLSELLTGGSIAGLNAFMFASYTASSIVIYTLVRLLLPGQPTWALLAAASKLVWPANAEIFDNSGVIIYFAEALFWFGVLQFVLFSRRPSVATAAGIVISVAVTCGTYQGFWPLVTIAPLYLIAGGVSRWDDARTKVAALLWALSSVPMMVWSVHASVLYVTHLNPTVPLVATRIAAGTWNALIQPFIDPVTPIYPHLPWVADKHLNLSLAALGILGLLAYLGSAPLCDGTPKSRRVALISILAGVTATAATIAATALKFEPTYLTRFMALPAGPAILVFGASAALASSALGRVGELAALAVMAVFLLCSANDLNALGERHANAGFTQKRFWEDVAAELPRVEEGTICVFDENAPAGIPVDDVFTTTIFRQLSGSHLTYFLSERPAVRQDGSWSVTTTIDLDQNEPVFNRRNMLRDGADSRGPGVIDALYYDRSPLRLPAPHKYIVPADRVVVLRWRPESRKLWVDKQQSNLRLIHADVPSTFGHHLFPAAETARDRR